MSKDINPFTNADKTARQHADANEAVLATVKNLSDDETMAAVSDVDKDSKYACRVPDNLTVQEGDSVIVDTAAGGRPFVTNVIEGSSVDNVDVADDGTVVVSGVGEIDFTSGISASANGDTASVQHDYVVDDYAYMVPNGNDSWTTYQADENHLASLGVPHRSHGDTERILFDSVYAKAEDELFTVGADENIYRIETDFGTYTQQTLETINNPFNNTSYQIESLAYDSNNGRVIAAGLDTGNNTTSIVSFDATAGSHTVQWTTDVESSTAARIVIDYSSDGYVYAGCVQTDTIYQLDESGTIQQSTSQTNPFRLSVRPDQDFFVVDTDTSDVIRYNDSLSKVATVNPPSSLQTARDVSATANNQAIVIVSDDNGVGGMFGINSAGDTIAWRREMHQTNGVTLGVTPQNRAYTHHTKEIETGNDEFMVFAIDPDSGEFVYKNNVSAQAAGNRAIIAPRPGAYPGDF